MSWYWLGLGVLSVWRVTHLFQAEDGPWQVVARFRKLLGNSFWGDLLDCFNCLSLWVAVPLAWLTGATLREQLILILALSGAAILLERLTARPESAPGPYSKEE